VTSQRFQEQEEFLGKHDDDLIVGRLASSNSISRTKPQQLNSPNTIADLLIAGSSFDFRMSGPARTARGERGHGGQTAILEREHYWPHPICTQACETRATAVFRAAPFGVRFQHDW
jgi:hypothetical protein